VNEVMVQWRFDDK